MMRQFSQWAAVLMVVLLFTSCGDSHERLMGDQIEWMGEIAEVFVALEEGELSSEQAVQRMDALKQQKGALAQRRAELGEGLTQAEATKLVETYSRPISEALGDVMHAMQKAKQSGKVTRELQDALMEMELF